MNHEQDDNAGRDGSGEPPRGRPGEHHPEPSPDSTPPEADQRDGDRAVSDENGALRAKRDEIDSIDDAIEAELVNDPPKERLRSVMSQWAGKLPHPDDAERYELISPGTLDRLISIEERRMGVVEREVHIAEMREATVRGAIEAESDVKRSLAAADKGALQRGQWQSWSISLVALGAVFLGLVLGYPQALFAIIVPIVQAGASLVRTVTQARNAGEDADRTSAPTDGEDDE